MQSTLASVASILERPVEQLQELDRRPLPLAFIEGHYETYVVRDLETGDVLEITLDLSTGSSVDPIELRQRDRERASVEGRKLEPDLLDLVLRHPDLEQINVRLIFSLMPLRPSAPVEADWSDPGLRQEFQSRLDAELGELKIEVPLNVQDDAPTVDATLSAPQIVRLGGSELIDSIKLAAEPIIRDD